MQLANINQSILRDQDIARLNPLLDAVEITGTWGLGNVTGNGTNGYAVSQVAFPDANYPGQSTRLVSNTDYGLFGLMTFSTATVLPNGVIQLLVHIPKFTGAGNSQNTQTLRFRLTNEAHSGSDSAYTNCFTCYCSVPTGTWLITLGGEHNPEITGQAINQGSEASNAFIGTGWLRKGTVSWSTAWTQLDISSNTGSGTPGNFYIRGVYAGGQAKPVLSVRIDDGRSSAISLIQPVLADLQIPATMFIIPDAVGTTNYATEAQLDGWYKAGNDLGGHSKTHGIGADVGGGTGTAFLSLTSHISRIYPEYEFPITWLSSRGYTRNRCHLHCTSPFSNSETKQVKQAHEDAFRQLGILSCGVVTNFMPGVLNTNPYSIPGMYMLENSANMSPDMIIARTVKASEVGLQGDLLLHTAIADAASVAEATLDAKIGKIRRVLTYWKELERVGKAIIMTRAEAHNKLRRN